MWVSVPLLFAASSSFYFDVVTAILLLLDIHFLFFIMPCGFNKMSDVVADTAVHICVVFFQREPFAFGVEISIALSLVMLRLDLLRLLC